MILNFFKKMLMVCACALISVTAMAQEPVSKQMPYTLEQIKEVYPMEVAVNAYVDNYAEMGFGGKHILSFDSQGQEYEIAFEASPNDKSNVLLKKNEEKNGQVEITFQIKDYAGPTVHSFNLNAIYMTMLLNFKNKSLSNPKLTKLNQEMLVMLEQLNKEKVSS